MFIVYGIRLIWIYSSRNLIIVDNVVGAGPSKSAVGGIGRGRGRWRGSGISFHWNSRRLWALFGRSRLCAALTDAARCRTEHCSRTVVRPWHGAWTGRAAAATWRQRRRYKHSAGRLPWRGRSGSSASVTVVQRSNITLTQLPHQLFVVHRQSFHRLWLTLELPQQVLMHLRQLPVNPTLTSLLGH